MEFILLFFPIQKNRYKYISIPLLLHSHSFEWGDYIGRRPVANHKRRLPISASIPKELQERIEESRKKARSRCNNSEFLEVLIRRGLAVWNYEHANPDEYVSIPLKEDD
jgi:hypothetical protein